MNFSATFRAATSSVGLATLLSLLLNSAPHGEFLSFERLAWIALSLFLYSSLVMIVFAVPAHMLLRRLGLVSLIYYLAIGGAGICIAYAILYRIVTGEIWLGGMLEALIYNALVGIVVIPWFHNIAYANKSQPAN